MGGKMKKIIVLLLLFVSIGFAQDVNTTVSQTYKDTLTATIDTIVVRFQSKWDYYTLALQRTSSGTDTVIVQTASFGETYWTTKAIVDLSTGDYITSLYVTATAAKEYIIADADVRAVRLITADGSAATEFVLSGRKGQFVQGNSVNLISILAAVDQVEAKLDLANASLDNIEADADSTVDMVTAIKDTLNDIHTDLIVLKNKDFATETTLGAVKDTLNDIHTDLIVLKNKDFATSVKQDSAEVTLNNIEASLLILRGYTHPYTLAGASQSTVTTEVDTITFTSTTVKVKWTVFAIDDTLEIALDGSFAGAVPLYPYISYTFDNVSATSFPKGYIRRKGGAGTASYASNWQGY